MNRLRRHKQKRRARKRKARRAIIRGLQMITVEEAQELVRAFKRIYPGLASWHAQLRG